MSLYFDYHAHTPLDPDVRSTLYKAFTAWDVNPHAQSLAGENARSALDRSREAAAALVGFSSKDIIFTSGATEANNLAIRGVADHLSKVGRKRIIVSAIEHPSVLETAGALGMGFEVLIAPVQSNGRIDLDALSNLISPSTGLVSIAAANHEIGVVQPIADIGKITRSQGALFHSDLAQAAGKIELPLQAVDLVSLSAHKLHGPLGVGALGARRAVRRLMAPALTGGGQEAGLRSGTVPTPLCVAFGLACDIAGNRLEADSRYIANLRDQLLSGLSQIPGCGVNGPLTDRLPGNLSIFFEGVDAEALVMKIRDRLVISTGSACSAHTLEPSPVLKALGLDQTTAESTIRIGIGRFTTEREVFEAIDILRDAVMSLRQIGIRIRA